MKSFNAITFDGKSTYSAITFDGKLFLLKILGRCLHEFLMSFEKYQGRTCKAVIASYCEFHQWANPKIKMSCNLRCVKMGLRLQCKTLSTS